MDLALLEDGAGISADDVVAMAADWRKSHFRNPIIRGLAAQEFHRSSAVRADLHNLADVNAVFAEDLVRETIAGIIQHEFPGHKFASGELIAIQTGGDPGAESFAWNEMKRTGEPARTSLVAESSQNITEIDVALKRNKQDVNTMMRGFSYTIGDLERARFQGLFDMINVKSVAVKEQLSYDIDEFIGVGEAGFWPSIYAVPGAITGIPAITGDWDLAATDSAELIADVAKAISTHRQETGGVRTLDTMIVPMNLWDRLVAPYGPEGARSRLELIRAAYPELKTVTWERNCPAGTALFYSNTPDVIAAKLPLYLQFLPPEVNAAAFRVIVRNRFGGIYSQRPRHMLTLTGLHS